MAVVQVFGPEGQDNYINLKCRMCRIVSYLRNTVLANRPGVVDIDLADVDGNLKHIDEHMEEEGFQQLQNNAKYILCSYTTAADGTRKYQVLYENPEAKFPDFELETERREREAQKRSVSQASTTSSTAGSWGKVRRKSREVKPITGSTGGGSKSRASAKTSKTGVSK